MSFIQIKLKVPASDVEQASNLFMELGALSATIEDAEAGTDLEQAIFNEPDTCYSGSDSVTNHDFQNSFSYDTTKVWSNNMLSVLFNHEIDYQQIVEQIQKLLNIPLKYLVETIDDQDWIKLTQDQFKPIKITDNFYIIPSWRKDEQRRIKAKIKLTLDPGLAFGTGSHPTTFLCLAKLEQLSNDSNFKPQSILDYGCGSGILAIASRNMWVNNRETQIYAVDIDEQAIEASVHNAKINHAHIICSTPQRLPPNTTYDLVVANILANPLRILAPALAKLSSYRLLLSGILSQQEKELISYYAQWFNLAEKIHKDGWVLLNLVKKP